MPDGRGIEDGWSMVAEATVGTVILLYTSRPVSVCGVHIQPESRRPLQTYSGQAEVMNIGSAQSGAGSTGPPKRGSVAGRCRQRLPSATIGQGQGLPGPPRLRACPLRPLRPRACPSPSHSTSNTTSRRGSFRSNTSPSPDFVHSGRLLFATRHAKHATAHPCRRRFRPPPPHCYRASSTIQLPSPYS
jgi:hypothetical protein